MAGALCRMPQSIDSIGVPDGIRTRFTAVKVGKAFVQRTLSWLAERLEWRGFEALAC
jgi:hypothetical protein